MVSPSLQVNVGRAFRGVNDGTLVWEEEFVIFAQENSGMRCGNRKPNAKRWRRGEFLERPRHAGLGASNPCINRMRWT